MSAIKSADTCGGSLASSLISVVESAYAQMKGSLQLLSTQQVADCIMKSCSSGSYLSTWIVMALQGLEHEADYPSRRELGQCAYDASKVAVRMLGFWESRSKNESALAAAVAKAPVAAVLTISPRMKQYAGGIFEDADCVKTGEGRAAVAVVGYGSQDGADYWIVKMSWGSGWGEAGYLRMARGKGTACGIADDFTAPIGLK